MYIQISSNPDAPVMISRKLYKSMELDKSKSPWFIQLSVIRGTDRFAIVRRTAQDTFKTQCSMLTPTGSKKNPAYFLWTIPSLEYFLAVTGIEVTTTKILKVKKVQTDKLTYWEICNR